MSLLRRIARRLESSGNDESESDLSSESEKNDDAQSNHSNQSDDKEQRKVSSSSDSEQEEPTVNYVTVSHPLPRKKTYLYRKKSKRMNDSEGSSDKEKSTRKKIRTVRLVKLLPLYTFLINSVKLTELHVRYFL